MSDPDDPVEQVRDVRPDRRAAEEADDPWILRAGRDRLMSMIEHTSVEPGTSWRPPAIYPRLGDLDERAAVAFLIQAFDFRERREARREHDGHNVTVDDVDAHFARAVAAGAVVTMELSDAFFGERRYEATDPEGNRWHFGEPLKRARARRGT